MVIAWSATAAWVVTTFVTRFGGRDGSVGRRRSGMLSQVSLRWTLYPVQRRAARPPLWLRTGWVLGVVDGEDGVGGRPWGLPLLVCDATVITSG